MKHSYQTRRLLALRDMRHDGQNVVAGGEVFATETDAAYLIRTGHARAPEEAAPPTAAIAVPIKRGPGRPPKVTAVAPPPAAAGQNDDFNQAAPDVPAADAPGSDAAD